MEVWILRVLHISCGMLWAGYAVFAGFLLIPALGEAGPAGGAVMGSLMKRKLSPIIAAISGITVLTGLWLYAIYYNGDWMRTSTGILLSLGALAALTAFVYGMIVTKPAADKMGALSIAIHAAGGPPSAEHAAQLAALRTLLGKAAKLNATLLAIAALCMAASRYAPQF